MAFAYEISPSSNHVQIVGTVKITTADCIGLVVKCTPLARQNIPELR